MELNKRIPGTRLTPIEFVGKIRMKRSYHYVYQFRCDCGKLICKRSHSIGSGKKRTKSCGCLRDEWVRNIKKDPKKYCTKAVQSSWIKKGQSLNKTRGSTGKTAHNRGKICIYENQNVVHKNSKRKYVTQQQLNEMYYGV
jgi:hypothetical protein|tara:strand:- start:363 stop:782 length:420 start_codon:yes stop_codon:yes gene_type:complete